MRLILCALALSSICETNMKCEDYAAAIAAEQDPAKRDELMHQYEKQCSVAPGDVSTNADSDSGPHGPPPSDD